MGRIRSEGMDPKNSRRLELLSRSLRLLVCWLARTVQNPRPWDVEQRVRRNRKVGWAVLTCDYNGWNDAPEDEREWFDQHPEIWGGLVRDSDKRPYRVTPRSKRRG